jgi:hypothetical protein
MLALAGVDFGNALYCVKEIRELPHQHITLRTG